MNFERTFVSYYPWQHITSLYVPAVNAIKPYELFKHLCMLHLIMTSPIALFLSEITTYIPVNVYRLTISVTVLIPNDVVYADLQYMSAVRDLLWFDTSTQPQYKDHFYRYGDSHYQDKTVVNTSYLFMVISNPKDGIYLLIEPSFPRRSKATLQNTDILITCHHYKLMTCPQPNKARQMCTHVLNLYVLNFSEETYKLLMCSQLISFLHNAMAQVVEILPRGRVKPTYFTWSIL